MTTNTQPILSIARSPSAAEPELRSKSTLCGMPLISLETAADLIVLAQDGATLAIRYMAAGTFLHALRSDSLFGPLALLSALSPWCYLIIRDVLSPDSAGRTLHDGRLVGWAWSAVQGALMSIQELGISIVSIKDESQLEPTLESLARRDRTTKRLRPPRETLFTTPGEAILLDLPGIGEDKAETLLRFYGSPARILAALTEPGAPVPDGIGPKTCQGIREALGLPDNHYLTIYESTTQ